MVPPSTSCRASATALVTLQAVSTVQAAFLKLADVFPGAADYDAQDVDRRNCLGAGMPGHGGGNAVGGAATKSRTG